MALTPEEQAEFEANKDRYVAASRSMSFGETLKNSFYGLLNILGKLFICLAVAGLLNRYVIPYGFQGVFWRLTIAIIVVILMYKYVFLGLKK